jgi:hypothetical protein
MFTHEECTTEDTMATWDGLLSPPDRGLLPVGVLQVGRVDLVWGVETVPAFELAILRAIHHSKCP